MTGPVLTTENRYKQLLPHRPPISQTIAVLDVRKAVAARNDFVNLVDGCIETTLYSTLSSSHYTCIHYANVPFSSSHAEGNQYLTASHGQQHVGLDHSSLSSSSYYYYYHLLLIAFLPFSIHNDLIPLATNHFGGYSHGG